MYTAMLTPLTVASGWLDLVPISSDDASDRKKCLDFKHLGSVQPKPFENNRSPKWGQVTYRLEPPPINKKTWCRPMEVNSHLQFNS